MNDDYSADYSAVVLQYFKEYFLCACFAMHKMFATNLAHLQQFRLVFTFDVISIFN